MNKTERFPSFSVRDRAGQYAKTRRHVQEIYGDDAVPIRTRRIEPDGGLSQKIREAEILYGMKDKTPESKSSYRVRESLTRSAARSKEKRERAYVYAAAGATPTVGARPKSSSGDGIRGGPKKAHSTKRPYNPPGGMGTSRGSAPDPAMNTDEIFISQKERDERKVAAYRLAQRRKIGHQVRRAVSAVLLVCVFAGCAMATVYKLMYVIRTIDVTGMERYVAEDILNATGVREGANLYSFSSRLAENAVTLRYPYVQSLDVSREAPSTIRMTVTEDTAVFYAEIYGETRALSATLRVLDRIGAEDIEEMGLIHLRMPAVESAMAGRVITFREEKHMRQIRESLAMLLESPLSERITSVDLRNPRNLSMVADGRFLLEFGDSTDMGVKMKIAGAVLADNLFKTDIKAQIDLSVSSSTSVILDNQLKLDT